MNRRDCFALPLILAGCGGEMEYEIQNSPTRVESLIHSDVPGYANGNWTPTLGGTATYTVQVGRYTKIGTRVFFNFELVVNVIGTGQVGSVLGLPFKSKPLGSGHSCSCGVFSNLTTSVVFLTGAIGEDSSTITLNSLTAASTQTLNNSILGNGSRILMSGHYDI